MILNRLGYIDEEFFPVLGWLGSRSPFGSFVVLGRGRNRNRPVGRSFDRPTG